jgi:hypothetical protein
MDKQLARIYELKLELLRLGYQGCQVDAIQRGAVGYSLPEEVVPAKRQELIDTLEKYAYFASRHRVGGGCRYGPEA